MIKRILFICFCICLIFSICISILFFDCKKEISLKDDIINNLSIKLNTCEPQLMLNIENVGKHLHDIAITDSTGNMQMLSEFMVNRKKIVVCRYSMRFCQECNEYAITTLCKNLENTELKAVLFINDNDNQRITRLEQNEYNIKGYHYCNCKDLEIPAENVMFPYYMIIDNKLRINNIYFPNKESKELGVDSVNLQLIIKSLVD